MAVHQVTEKLHGLFEGLLLDGIGAFRDELLPGSRIKLLHTTGTPKYVVQNKDSWGLIAEVSAGATALSRDPTGFFLAREIASRAFDLYGPDRPIYWVEFRMTRPDGTRLPPIALERGEGAAIVPVETGMR